jgi:hypothetical protein
MLAGILLGGILLFKCAPGRAQMLVADSGGGGIK